MEKGYEFQVSQNSKSSMIKVIGVGGGGGNAVNYMYQQGIKDVDFYLVNTDNQALESSPVPHKIRIGKVLTEGLGAGASPETGRSAAEEDIEEIREVLGDNTKMVFITAGMGGGTGTGAAPVIASVAREKKILTVAIVTMPFFFEGRPKAKRAEEGIEELKKHCDTVLVILNNKLKEVYGKASMKEAFSQADNVLTTAAKSIAEIITVSGNINVDFKDVQTVMKNSGAAVMGSTTVEGENRARRAAEGALTSPLLNDTNIHGAKYILLSITVGDEDSFEMEELEEITEYIQEQAGESAEIIFGHAIDSTLGDAITVTLIATGFNHNNSDNKEVIDLESSRRFKKEIIDTDRSDFFDREDDMIEEDSASNNDKVVFDLDGDYEKSEPTDFDLKKKHSDYLKRKNSSLDQNDNKSVKEMSNEEIKEKQDMPAYLRKGVKLKDTPHSYDNNLSKYSLNSDNEILGDNKFFYDNVD